MPAALDPRSGPVRLPGGFFRAFVERKAALLFVVGIASGFPLGYSWFNLSDLLVTAIRSADARFTADLFPTWSAYVALTLGGLVAFLLAPFMDRGPAPGFGRWGHRRSWVAASLIVALVLGLLVFVASLVVAPGRESPIEGVLFFQSILAIPITAVMLVGVDALRVELAPGRAQAIAYTSQFIGSLAGGAMLGALAGTGEAGPRPLLLGVFVVQLAIGLVAVAKMPEPAPAAAPPIPRIFMSEAAWFLRPPEYLWFALTQPWTAFFVRHGAAAPLLLAAVALYGLAWSAGQQLTVIGFAITDEAERDRATATWDAISWLTYALSLLGGLIGATVALRFSPARAFVVLQKAILALILLLAVLKLTTGAKAEAFFVIGIVRTILNGAAFVIYMVVAARLTVPPHTAGQFYLLSTVLALFWLSGMATTALDAALGTFVAAGAVCACAIGAIGCMYLAGRIARQHRPRPAPSAGPAA